MTSQSPTPEQAAAALNLVSQHKARTARPVLAVRIAMLGFAAASAAAILILGFAPGKGAAIGASAMMFGASIALLVIAIPAQNKVRERHFSRRYSTAILAWGVIFALANSLGFTVFHGEPLFWAAAALLSAVPGAWFAFSTAQAKS